MHTVIRDSATVLTCKNRSFIRAISYRVKWRCKLTCLIERTAKCTKQHALNAAKNVKYHSSLAELDLYTAENVLLNEEDTNITN